MQSTRRTCLKQPHSWSFRNDCNEGEKEVRLHKVNISVTTEDGEELEWQ